MEISINQKGWAVTRLEDIATRITKGGTPTTYGYSFQKSGINFLKVENISEGRANLKSIMDFIGEDAHEFQTKSQLSVNDILFSIAGTIGETCVIHEEYLPANTNQALAIIKGTDTAIIPKLLQLQLEAYVAKVKLKARGGAMSNVSLEDLKNLLVYIPPLPEQHRIVAKIEELFSSLDKGIESLKKAQEQLKIYRQAVLKWAFEGKLTSNHLNCDSPDKYDVENKSQKNHDNQINHKNQSSDNLPEGWKVEELKNITIKAKKVRANEQDSNKEFLYLDIGSIDNTTFKIKNHKTYKWKDAPSRAQQIIEFEDTLFSTVRTYLKNIAFVDKNIYQNQIASSGFTVIRADKKNIIPKYLFYYSTFQCFINPLNNLQTGTSYPAVRDADVLSQHINYPLSICEQKQIVSEIESRLSVCDKIEEIITTSLKQTEALRQSILKKAFEGKLVPQDPNDEPARALLARIKAEKEKNSPAKKTRKIK